MVKKNKLKKRSLLTGGILLFTIIPLSISLGLKTDTSGANLQSTSLQSSTNSTVLQDFKVDTSESSQGYTLYELEESDGSDSGIGIKVPNFSDSSDTAQTDAKTILSMYDSLPSNIDTSASTIWNLIQINSDMWTTSGTYAAKIFNLGKTATYNNNYLNSSTKESSGIPTDFSSYSITSESNLPAFSAINNSDSVTNVSEEYLDTNGILALQITVQAVNTTNNNTWQSFYIFISGFNGTLSPNALSNNPMLPSNLYTSGVSSVSNDDLVSFLSNSYTTTLTTTEYTAASIPAISIDSRTNNNTAGSMSFTANFSFTIPSDLSFSSGFAGVTDNSTSLLTAAVGKSVAVSTDNTYNSSTSYDVNFNLTGFQPDPAVSDTDVVIIVAVIIAVIVVLCILGFLTTRVSRAIRFKNAM